MSETDGLPDVDLTGVTQDKAPEDVSQQTQDAQPSDTVEDTAIRTFKTLEDAEIGYKNVQGAYTKVTQENKELREQLAQIQEQVQLMQLGQTQAPIPQQDFDSQYIENPQEAIEGVVKKRVQEQVLQAQIASTLEEINLQNPAEFQDRYAYAKMLSQQYPQLVTSPAGVRKLFELGDKQREVDMRRTAQKSVSMLFGEDVDLEKIKALARKDPQQSNINQAYMPDTTQSTRIGTEPEISKDGKIAQAVQEGDPDKVLEELFK